MLLAEAFQWELHKLDLEADFLWSTTYNTSSQAASSQLTKPSTDAGNEFDFLALTGTSRPDPPCAHKSTSSSYSHPVADPQSSPPPRQVKPLHPNPRSWNILGPTPSPPPALSPAPARPSSPPTRTRTPPESRFNDTFLFGWLPPSISSVGKPAHTGTPDPPPRLDLPVEPSASTTQPVFQLSAVDSLAGFGEREHVEKTGEKVNEPGQAGSSHWWLKSGGTVDGGGARSVINVGNEEGFEDPARPSHQSICADSVGEIRTRRVNRKRRRVEDVEDHPVPAKRHGDRGQGEAIGSDRSRRLEEGSERRQRSGTDDASVTAEDDGEDLPTSAGGVASGIGMVRTPCTASPLILPCSFPSRKKLMPNLQQAPTAASENSLKYRKAIADEQKHVSFFPSQGAICAHLPAATRAVLRPQCCASRALYSMRQG